MKLSIITINLNNSIGLKKTIESVVNQSSEDFEYIVIDGGSTDGSIDVIKEFKDKISYWESEPDNGIYHAMNKGLKMAKGEYCQFLNSGDYLSASDVTERMLSNMPECSILYGNMLKLMAGGWILNNKEIPVNSLLTFYTGTLNHSSAYIKRNLFEKYGYYDENLKIVSDWKFYLITVGLNSESVSYRDIDVSCFDMKGISNTNNCLDKAERLQVLKEVLPVNVFADYKRYASGIMQMKRINRYKFTKWIVWFIERVLFKLEKFETKRKKKHLF